MEQPSASLEELSAWYDEGMKLADALQKRLELVSGKLKAVAAGEDGEIVLCDTGIGEEESL